MKLFTNIEIERFASPLQFNDSVVSFGSCFANEIGELLQIYGFDALVNPFGTLYNVGSIYNSIKRLCDVAELMNSGESIDKIEGYPLFGNADIVSHPDGYDVTFSHHSSIGKKLRDNFLEGVNNKLVEDALYLKQAGVVIITLGTSFVFRRSAKASCASQTNVLNNSESKYYDAQYYDEKFHSQNVEQDKVEGFDANEFCRNIVSNCHKLPAIEFDREFIHSDECYMILSEIVKLLEGKRVIFTVSPIRHLADGLHGNQISKSALLLAVQRVIYGTSDQIKHGFKPQKNLYYFPSYEIMMDELRDYRWYAEDLVHPSKSAIKYIFEKFKESCIAPQSYSQMEEALRRYKSSMHIIK